MSLEATVSAEHILRQSWDVIIIGAGPAGALAGRQLASCGVQTLLVDRQSFPRGKVCGACISNRALSTLRSVGLTDVVEELKGTLLERFEVWAKRRHASLELPAGIASSRLDFDAYLIQAAIDAGVHFLPRTEARLGGIDTERRLVELRPWQAPTVLEARAAVVLVASGLTTGCLEPRDEFRSRTIKGSRIGAGATVPADAFEGVAGTIYMAVARQGYVGLVRLHDGRWNVAAALDAHAIRAREGLSSAVNAILGESGISRRSLMNTGTWRGTLPLTRRTTPVAAERVFLLGDAAGYIEPFTGEGIAWALDSAVEVAPLVRTALSEWSSDLVVQWEHRQRKMIKSRQWMCRTIASVLRRPLLVTASLQALARMPSLARPVIRALNRPLARN